MGISNFGYVRKDNAIVLRMKGDMRMNILNDILEKEGDNRGFVYLYYLEDSWKAFGYSAFCLSLLYPG